MGSADEILNQIGVLGVGKEVIMKDKILLSEKVGRGESTDPRQLHSVCFIRDSL